MKRKRCLGLTCALAVPFITTGAPYPLDLPAEQYALVPMCRFQGPDLSPIGANPLPFEWFKFNGTNYLSVVCLGNCTPDSTVSPGEGAVLLASADAGVFLFQQYKPSKLPLILQPGLNLVCSQSDIDATFEDIVGTPPDNGVMLFKFNPGLGRNPFNLAPPDYSIYTFSNGAWSPTIPVVGITEAVFVLQPPRLFNVRATSNGIS